MIKKQYTHNDIYIVSLTDKLLHKNCLSFTTRFSQMHLNGRCYNMVSFFDVMLKASLHRPYAFGHLDPTDLKNKKPFVS